MFTESFVILLATLIFVGLFGKKGWAALQSMLEGRIDKIKASINEAEKLKQEAQNLLATTKRKHMLAHEEAEKIITHAREEAENLKAKMQTDFEQTFKRRERMALERIHQMEAQTLQSIKVLISTIAIEATKQNLQSAEDTKGEDLLEEITHSLEHFTKKTNTVH